MIYSLFAYASDPGFHIFSGLVRYISSIPSKTSSYGLDVEKYKNTPCRKNVIRMSNLVKYMMWSTTDGYMAWIFAVSLTTRPAFIMMNGGMSLLSMLGSDREFLNTSTYTFAVY